MPSGGGLSNGLAHASSAGGRTDIFWGSATAAYQAKPAPSAGSARVVLKVAMVKQIAFKCSQLKCSESSRGI